MRTDRCRNIRGQKCRAKRSGKEAKIQEFMYTDTMNAEHETYDYTGTYWSNRNSTEGLKKNLETMPRTHSIDSLQKTANLGTSHVIC